MAQSEVSNMSASTALEIDVNSETESTTAHSMHSSSSHTERDTPRQSRSRSLRSRDSTRLSSVGATDANTSRTLDTSNIVADKSEDDEEKDQLKQFKEPNSVPKTDIQESLTFSSQIPAMVAEKVSTVTTASHYLDHRGGNKKDTCITVHNTPKKRRNDTQMQECYCWECHRECVDSSAKDCYSCTRTFHDTCLPTSFERPAQSGSNWSCPVCMTVSSASCKDIPSMKNIDRPQLNKLLSYALTRMKHKDSGPFQAAVPATLVPDYLDYVFHPFDLSILEKNCKNGHYRCIDEFMEDAKWIVHNSCIFNGAKSKYTADAKLIMRICKHEISELKLCPDCYRLSTERPEGWFSRPCHSPAPHCLVWAKLKGYPWWPAKALQIANPSSVDVRFFGEYDRGRVTLKECMLLSREPPQSSKAGKKQGIERAIEEMNDHVKQLINDGLTVNYAPANTPFKVEHMEKCPIFDENCEWADISGGSQPEPSPSPAPSDKSVASSAAESTTRGNRRVSAGKDKKETPVKSTRSRVDKDVFTMDDSVLKAFRGDRKKLSDARDYNKTDEPSANEEGEETILERLEQTLAHSQRSSESPASVNDMRAPEPAATTASHKEPSSKSTPNKTLLARALSSGHKRHREEEKPSTSAAVPTEAKRAKLRQSEKVEEKPEEIVKEPQQLGEVLQSHKDKVISSLQTAVCSLFDQLAQVDLTVSAAINDANNQKANKSTEVEENAPSTSTAASAAELEDARSTAKHLSSELQAMRFANDAFVNELKRSTMSVTNDIKKLAEVESQAQMRKQRQKFEHQLQETIQQVKSKQWCSNCGKEAVFYCCWNTSYCDYPCQQAHWPKHQTTCAQVNNPTSKSSSGTNQSSSVSHSSVVSQSSASPLASAALYGSHQQQRRDPMSLTRGMSPNQTTYRTTPGNVSSSNAHPYDMQQAMARTFQQNPYLIRPPGPPGPYLNGGLPPQSGRR